MLKKIIGWSLIGLAISGAVGFFGLMVGYELATVIFVSIGTVVVLGLIVIGGYLALT
ncbi:hypothetical protein MYX06_02265 [Patescibacteria group bacterium AH-259-L05]|nr:hypothetical protein [Patescibacteria group bacterium AH-259-L05]